MGRAALRFPAHKFAVFELRRKGAAKTASHARKRRRNRQGRKIAHHLFLPELPESRVVKKRISAKFVAAFVVCLILNNGVFACPVCRAAVNQTIYDESFWFNALALLSPLVLPTIFGVGLFYAGELQFKFAKILKWRKTNFR